MFSPKFATSDQAQITWYFSAQYVYPTVCVQAALWFIGSFVDGLLAA